MLSSFSTPSQPGKIIAENSNSEWSNYPGAEQNQQVPRSSLEFIARLIARAEDYRADHHSCETKMEEP
jgi:hypothetical protein